MPISPFGWNNNEPPPISAENLERMLGDAGAYTDAETVRAEAAEATNAAAIAAETTRAEGVEGLKANINSPALTGTPTTTTPATSDNSTRIADTAWVRTVVSGTVNTQALAAAQPFIVDSPDFHGAKHDGVTDDTVAIKTAISSAVAAAQANGSNYAEVWFSAATYFVGGALDKSQLGNSQIPIPNIGSHATVPKVILVLKGIADGTGLPHFLATSPFRSGTILLSNLNAPYDATYGWPSVLGGPTPEQMPGTEGGLPIHSNMLIVIDGLFVSTNYTNPSCVAVDLSTIIEANVKSLGVSADVSPPSVVTPTNISIGLWMPTHGNQLNCNISSYSVEAFYYGLAVGEGMNANSVRSVYCHSAIYLTGGNATGDGSRIEHLLTEVGTNGVDASGVNGLTHLDIGTWNDSAAGDTWSINDPSNYLLGSTNYNGGGNVPKVNGGANYTVIEVSAQRGNLGSFVTPASGTAFTTIWRNATFYFAPTVGVSNISVGGKNIGLTNGSVRVPSGFPVYVSYSGSAPAINAIILD